MSSTDVKPGFSLRNTAGTRPRWWPLIVGVLLTTLLVGLRQSGYFALTDKPSMDLLLIFAAANLLIYLLVRLACRLTLLAQLVTITAFVVAQGVTYAASRIDGFTGDGRLILAWRWTPSAQQQFLLDRQEPATQIPELADLTDTRSTDVPSFRGHDRTGRFTAQFDDNWQTNPPRELWRRRVGTGWSSFAVVGDYAVTQEQRGAFECVVCYRISTGKEIWEHRDKAEFFEITGGGGPRATPTIDAGKVYSFGATGLLNCIDGRDGKVLWSENMANEFAAPVPLFGFTGSPLVVDDMVIVEVGGQRHSLVAIDKATGQKRWAAGNAPASYCSPQVSIIGDKPYILSFNAEELVAHQISTGEIDWQFPWPCESSEVVNVCQPVVLRGDSLQLAQVFISSGYGRGSALVAILSGEEKLTSELLWKRQTLKSKFSSVVLHDGFVFGLDDGILECVEVASGMRKWKQGRYGYGQLLLAGDLLLIQAESGEVVLVKAQPQKFEEVGRLAALSERTRNHPVLSDRRLIVRNDREAACYELPPPR